VHNALDELMMEEIIEALDVIEQEKNTRFTWLRGKGKSFCAGANLQEMKTGFNSKLLASLLKKIYFHGNPVVAIAHGGVYGGGVGMLAAADLVIATGNTRFSLSEVRLGLVPAVISWFVVNKMGKTRAAECMLTAKKFNGHDAFQYNLVNWIVEDNDIDEQVKILKAQFNRNGPRALKEIKKLLQKMDTTVYSDSFSEESVALINKISQTDEAREGISAFFEKRIPGWDDNKK
jgi:methylglutaconyl-CoA hydratase